MLDPASGQLRVYSGEPIRHVETSALLTVGDGLIVVDLTAATTDATITLPRASMMLGKRLTIIRQDQNAGVQTIIQTQDQDVVGGSGMADARSYTMDPGEFCSVWAIEVQRWRLEESGGGGGAAPAPEPLVMPYVWYGARVQNITDIGPGQIGAATSLSASSQAQLLVAGTDSQGTDHSAAWKALDVGAVVSIADALTGNPLFTLTLINAAVDYSPNYFLTGNTPDTVTVPADGRALTITLPPVAPAGSSQWTTGTARYQEASVPTLIPVDTTRSVQVPLDQNLVLSGQTTAPWIMDGLQGSPWLVLGRNGCVGIGIPITGQDPAESLQVSGGIVVGAAVAATPVAGTIQFDGTHFFGFNGTAWVRLD